MNGGLDQQIQQKVDAYRGNPRALMQRYQQNQQLLDLLALQKLKSEKEAAARQMQMQMQQQPQTVAQQREQEVLGLTKQELAQQTQGIMQQRQAQQQKNLQQVAQGGIGALLQRPQAAPQPVPRMAGGGIVAFQPGGPVQGGLGAVGGLYGATEVGSADANRTPPIAFLTDPSIREMARRQGISVEQLWNALSDEAKERQRRTYADTRNIAPPRMPEASGQPVLPSAPPVPDGLSGAPEPVPERPVLGIQGYAREPRAYTPRGMGMGAEALANIDNMGRPPVSAEQPEPPAPDADAGGGAGGGGGIASLDLGGPEAAMRRGFAISDEYLGRGEKAARYAEMEAELARLDEGVAERARDPNRRLTQFLLGGGRQSSAAGAFGAAGRALLAYDEGVDRQERERLITRIGLAERGMNMDSELGRAGLQLGQTMFSEAAQNQRTAMQAANNMKVEEFRQMREDARQQATELKLDRAHELDRLKYELDAAKAARAASSEAYAAAADIVNNVQAARSAAIENILSTDQNYMMATMRLNQAESQEERQQAQAAVDAIINMAVLRANMVLDASDEGGSGLSLLSLEQQALELMRDRYFSDAGISPADVQTTTYTE